MIPHPQVCCKHVRPLASALAPVYRLAFSSILQLAHGDGRNVSPTTLDDSITAHQFTACALPKSVAVLVT